MLTDFKRKSYRHFSLYRVIIHMDYHLGPDQLDDNCSSEFACAFSLRQLRACVSVHRFFPRRFLTCSLDFELLGDCPDDYDTSAENKRCLHNYRQVEEMILRNCLFTLTVNFLSLYYNAI